MLSVPSLLHLGRGLMLVSPQPPAGWPESLGECHSLGKLPQQDPLSALFIHCII